MTHISHQSSVNVTAENVKASAVMENCKTHLTLPYNFLCDAVIQ